MNNKYLYTSQYDCTNSCDNSCNCGGVTRVCPPGPIGPKGPTGETGPKGETGAASLTAYGFFYNISGTSTSINPYTFTNIPLTIQGTPILNENLSANGVKVGLAGVYEINYYVVLGGNNPFGFTVSALLNGSSILGSAELVPIAVQAGTVVAGQAIVRMNANDTITIGASGTVGTLATQSASLTVIKIAD